MKTYFTKAVTLLTLVLFGSCHPEGPEFTEDLDVVYTDYDAEFDFSTQETFALPDSIILITNQNFVATATNNMPQTVDPVYADPLLDEIRENMIEYGWREVETVEDNPDVVLLVTVNRTTNLFYNYDWNYWDWWAPNTFNRFGMYYPGYTPGYISGYRSGTLMIQMANTANVGVNNNVPVVWLGIVNGLLEGDSENINLRLSGSIDQAFDQSPYLIIP